MVVLHLSQESDLYNPYAPEGYLLNEEAYNMIRTVCNDMTEEQHKERKLEIRCDSPVDEELAIDALRDKFINEREYIERTIKLNNGRAVRRYILGALLIIAGIVLSTLTDHLFLEFISILGGFAIENGAELQLDENSELKTECKMLEDITDWPIIFLYEAN